MVVILTKVSSNDTMPCWIVLLIELLFDVCCYIFLHIVLVQRL